MRSLQDYYPETVTQYRANFREIKGGGGKKTGNGQNRAKSAGICTDAGANPGRTGRDPDGRQLQAGSWYQVNRQRAFLFTGAAGTRRDPGGRAAGTRNNQRGRSRRRSGTRATGAADTRHRQQNRTRGRPQRAFLFTGRQRPRSWYRQRSGTRHSTEKGGFYNEHGKKSRNRVN